VAVEDDKRERESHRAESEIGRQGDPRNIAEELWLND
jgi:hypothetical protein